MTCTYKHTLYACHVGYMSQAIVNNIAPLLLIIFQGSSRGSWWP